MSLHNLIGRVTGQPSSYTKKSHYHFGKTLGAGTFGVVKYAKMNTTGEEVAVKIILKKTLKGNEKMVYDELAMLQQLEHPHIVRFKDWFESREKFYIVTQLATGGELFDRICEQGRFTEQDASRCIKEVLEAIDYLHSRNIVHRDLKPENLLYVTPEHNSDLVLADFGIAKTLNSPEEQLTSMAGSFGYAAPEILRGTGHGKPCDIWSLGVITYTVLSGYSPFRAENVPDFLEEVSDDYRIVCHERYWKHISHAAKEFIQSMLQVDPHKRPTTKELLKHPWIAGDEANSTEDLLPNIREGFNARQKFRRAIEAVRLSNRMRALQLADDESDDDFKDDSGVSESTLKALSAFGKSSTNKSGARFQEVVMAAARNKDIVSQEDQEQSDSTKKQNTI